MADRYSEEHFKKLEKEAMITNAKLDAIIDHLGLEFGLPKEESTFDKVIADLDPIPHITIGEQYLGMDEDDNNEQLASFLSVNPSTTAWCAWYGTACYKEAKIRHLGGVAKDYKEIGKKLNKPVKGCMSIHRNHFSFFYGYADKTKLVGLEAGFGKVTSLEEWEKVECDASDPNALEMVLGGNQGDMCNISPRYFYDNYSKFLGYYEHIDTKIKNVA